MKKEKKKPEKWYMSFTVWLWTVLCGSFTVVLFIFAVDRTIVMADASQNLSEMSLDSVGTVQAEPVELHLQRTEGVEGSFCVPLPRGTRSENVGIENYYMNQELWIYIQNGSQDFYRQNELYGDVSHVREGWSEKQEDSVLLKFKMDGVMEYLCFLQGDALIIAYADPHALYDFVVVLDPAGGGSDLGAQGSSLTEKELALEVAGLVQRKFDMQNARLYLTRVEDVDVEIHDRAEFANAVQADLYIRIGAQADPENPEAYGIQGSYNEDFFIPDYGNIELADTMTRAVTIAASNRAVGLVPAGEESVLHSIQTPAMELALGYLSNSREEALLEQDFYHERLAEGILDAIHEACESLEQLREEDE